MLFTRDIMLFSSHGLSRRSRSFHTSFLFVPNYRICELVYFHTEHRGESRSYCPEFSNCRIFLHTENRGESRGFVTRLVLWTHRPTGGNYRISFFTRRVTESLGIYVTNYRIVEFVYSRGRSRRFSLSQDMFFVTNLRISFFHAECHGWLWRL